MPNCKWVPIGDHGRGSSIVVSGQSFKRPRGQTKTSDAVAPSVGPSKRLDYELELGFFVGRGNALGEPIAIGEAEDHLFGVCLLNDWSARDLQGPGRRPASSSEAPTGTVCADHTAGSLPSLSRHWRTPQRETSPAR